MSVHTDYDDKRDSLREDLEGCLEKARELLDPQIWGYEEMKKDYAFNVYVAVKAALDSV